MAIYMKFGKIDGAVATTGLEKWIELSSMQWGVGRGIGSAARGSKNRESSEPSLSEITVTKTFDISSIQLFQDAVGGVLDAAVVIKFTQTVKDAVDTFLKIELDKCGLSGYSISSGGESPSESLSLNFTKITITHSATDEKGAGTPVSAGYDLEKMAKV